MFDLEKVNKVDLEGNVTGSESLVRGREIDEFSAKENKANIQPKSKSKPWYIKHSTTIIVTVIAAVFGAGIIKFLGLS
jgi:hypothetical protein